MTTQVDNASNLPDWPAADKVYSKAYQILQNMANRGCATAPVGKFPGHANEDMRELIDALNKGDEERIKGLLLYTHIYY